MAFHKDGSEVPLHVTADICDYVAAGETDEERAERRDEMARKHPKISREAISAMTAHVKFRIRDARSAVSAVAREHASTLEGAGLGLEVAAKADVEGEVLAKAVRRAQLAEAKSFDGYELMKQEKLSEAIAAFGAAGNVDALRAIADVYAEQRPDIAAKALLAAKETVKVLAMIHSLQDGNKAMAKRIVGLLGEDA